MSYKVKKARKELSVTFEFERLAWVSHHGAYRALRSYLATILSHEVSFHTLVCHIYSHDAVTLNFYMVDEGL